MNTETISMPEDEARRKLESYRGYLKRTKLTKANVEVRREYEEAERAFKELAKGTRLVNVPDVIVNAPQDEKGRPKLAMGRADLKEIHFSWGGRPNRYIFNGNKNWNTAQSKIFRCEATNVWPEDRPRWDSVEGYALIPLIPADVMPDRCDLSKHWILWEVEQWSDKSQTAQPSRDPFLLKHIGGPLYAIVAEWELTDLERLLVLGRRTK